MLYVRSLETFYACSKVNITFIKLNTILSWIQCVDTKWIADFLTWLNIYILDFKNVLLNNYTEWYERSNCKNECLLLHSSQICQINQENSHDNWHVDINHQLKIFFKLLF